MGLATMSAKRSHLPPRAEDPAAARLSVWPSRRRKPPGMSPGVPVLTGEALAPRIHAIRYTPDAIEEKDLAGAQECRELLAGEGVLWIDVQGLGDLNLLRDL